MLQVSGQTGKRKRIGAVRKFGAMLSNRKGQLQGELKREREKERLSARGSTTNGEQVTTDSCCIFSSLSLLFQHMQQRRQPKAGNGCGCEQLKDVCQKTREERKKKRKQRYEVSVMRCDKTWRRRKLCSQRRSRRSNRGRWRRKKFAIKIHLPQYDKCQQQNQSEKEILIMNENARKAKRPEQSSNAADATDRQTGRERGRQRDRQTSRTDEADAGHVAKSSSTTAHFINFGSEQLQL